MKPRLLFIGPLPEPTTGQSLACKVLLDSLHETYEVAVVDLRKASFRQGANSFDRVAEIGQAVAQVRREQGRADVIYLTISESVAGNLKDIAFYLASFGKLDRMIIHLHGGAGMRLLLAGKVPLLGPLNRFFLKRMGGVIVLGERLRGMYASSVAAEKIAIVENFAPSDCFCSDNQIERNHADLNELRVLFLSNLLPGKGYIELVEAIHLLTPSERARFRFDFAGGFEDDSSKKAFLDSVAEIEGVSYHGVVGGARKRELLAAAHLFCLPTYYGYEGQPISILEAYASGTAVLATDHAGIFDIFDPAVNGFAVEKRSAQSIAAALRSALENREALQKVALANVAIARERYREKHYTERMHEALARLAPTG